jgi:hypothetical protein
MCYWSRKLNITHRYFDQSITRGLFEIFLNIRVADRCATVRKYYAAPAPPSVPLI